MKFIKNAIILMAATALCGTLIYWLYLLHWSVAVAVTSIVVLGVMGGVENDR